MCKYDIGIIGVSGYVGLELLKIALNHENLNVKCLSSISNEGEKISDIFPNFINQCDLICTNASEVVKQCDYIFVALPHGLSEDIVSLDKTGKKVFIDLGADFRLKKEEDYKKWYGKEFLDSKLHESCAYGLVEWNFDQILSSNIIANPGCFPTSIALGLKPLLTEGLVEVDNIIVDSKSGATGAGKNLSPRLHFVELNETFGAYSIEDHRHYPEIKQVLSDISGEDVNVTFTPHLLPINRGIESTIYVKLKKDIDIESIREKYKEHYKNDIFINILDGNQISNIKYVKNTNNCFISIHLNMNSNMLVIVSCIDNMQKGAAGQAIQNLNLKLGLNLDTGLNKVASNF